jgi:hypothetical protein
MNKKPVLRLFSTSPKQDYMFKQYNNRPTYKRVNDIWEYALSNSFANNEQEMRLKFKSETDMALHILRALNDQENISNFKIFPLYNLGSKSRELQRDRLFWLMLSGITVSNRIITHSSKLKQLSIIAHCISRLPSITWVAD